MVWLNKTNLLVFWNAGKLNLIKRHFHKICLLLKGVSRDHQENSRPAVGIFFNNFIGLGYENYKLMSLEQQ